MANNRATKSGFAAEAQKKVIIFFLCWKIVVQRGKATR